MFKKYIILSVACFSFLILTTSIIKNKSRNLEKDITKLMKDISFLEKSLSDAEIDFAYLSGPEKLKESLEILNTEKYVNYESSRVFFSVNHYLQQESKETKFIGKKTSE